MSEMKVNDFRAIVINFIQLEAGIGSCFLFYFHFPIFYFLFSYFTFISGEESYHGFTDIKLLFSL